MKARRRSLSSPRIRGALHRLAALAAIVTIEARATAQPASTEAPQPPPQRGGAPAASAPAASSPPGPATTAPPEPREPDEKRNAARSHFERGAKLARDGAWAPALAEFLQSRQLSPSWGATSAAAVCLQKLGRFDEALAMFEVLLREYGDTLPPAAKDAALREQEALLGLVGSIVVDEAEPGAAIVIDGQSRGDAPLPGPLRVTAGSHAVRVYKEGYEAFEARVDVAGRGSVRVGAKLRVLARSGRLRVADRSSRKLEVLVDGGVVGTTPWEGPLAVGSHVVVLRGEADLGTQPASVAVRLGQLTTLTLAAEELSAFIRVEPAPSRASLVIDAVPVGRGAWEGRLRAGAHSIEVAASGYLTATREVPLARGERRVLTVKLKRDPDAGKPRPPERPWQRPLGIAGMGLGGAGVAAGAALGGLALSANAESNRDKRCVANDLCDATGLALRDKAWNLGNASTAAFIAGGVLLAGGVVLFVTAPSARQAPPRGREGGLRAGVEVTPGGLYARGAW